jgi:hypothetical protein
MGVGVASRRGYAVFFVRDIIVLLMVILSCAPVSPKTFRGDSVSLFASQLR